MEIRYSIMYTQFNNRSVTSVNHEVSSVASEIKVSAINNLSAVTFLALDSRMRKLLPRKQDEIAVEKKRKNYTEMRGV